GRDDVREPLGVFVRAGAHRTVGQFEEAHVLRDHALPQLGVGRLYGVLVKTGLHDEVGALIEHLAQEKPLPAPDLYVEPSIFVAPNHLLDLRRASDLRHRAFMLPDDAEGLLLFQAIRHHLAVARLEDVQQRLLARIQHEAEGKKRYVYIWNHRVCLNTFGGLLRALARLLEPEQADAAEYGEHGQREGGLPFLQQHGSG